MTEPVADRFAVARAVADAVLYEGYVLYPYRASSRKNQVRWQFGVLAPRAFSEAEGSERWVSRTECLVRRGPAPVLSVRIRCLQVQHRAVEVAAGDGSDAFVPVETFEVDGQMYVDWEEAVDQVVDLPPLGFVLWDGPGHDEVFHLAGGLETELVHAADGRVAGRVVRRRQPVEGRVRVVASSVGDGPLVKVTVTVENTTPWAGAGARREDIMSYSLVAVHTMLAVDGGSFVSLLEPPDDATDAVAGCHSDGTFPVLIGGEDLMLSSPIILYDYPEVAPESPGDLYDSTEIDEILALRVMTLTDAEKAEARGTDPRAAAIIDRCDDMPPEIWERLHGAVRSIGPATEPEPEPELDFAAGFRVGADGRVEPEPVAWWEPAVDAAVDPWSDSVFIEGVEVAKGTPVRLRPSHRADAQDLFLKGLTAVVAGVFKDVDGSDHVAVTLDDDPASAELVWQGRYLFFHPDEVEPLTLQDGAR